MMHKQYKRILSGMILAGLLVGSLGGCGLTDRKSSSASDAQNAEESAGEENAGEENAEGQEETPAETEEASSTADAAQTAVETADSEKEEGQTEEAAPQVTVERLEVDTSSMIPVEYSTEEGSIGLYLPADWIYRIDTYEGNQESFSISVQPDGEEGDIMLSFTADGSLVSAVDSEIGAEMYGYTGYQGTYDTASVWSYFRCTVNGGTYELCNNAGDFWWNDQVDTVNQILSTISFGEPLIGSAEPEKQGEAFDVNGETITVNLEGAEEVSATESAENMDGDIDDNSADYGALDITCGEQTLSLDDFCFGAREIYVLSVSDTISYILVESLHENDYTELFLIKADAQADQPLVLCDSLSAGISDTEGITTAGFAVEFRVNCMGTYGGSRHYTIYQDKFYTNDEQLHFNNASGSHMDVWSNTEGMDGEALDNLSKLYTEDGRMCLTLKTDMKACSSGGDEITIPAGMQICPTDVDEVNHIFYFDFIDYDQASGTYLTNYGYVNYETDESGYQITVDGVDQYELFETLPYAG